MDRLEQKAIITDRLKEVVRRYSELLPEEQAVAGIKDVSRKLGEFITTPAASNAWDYDELMKLDGPALFRKIHGAWGGGQRTGFGQVLIQPGQKRQITTPFGETKSKDVAPGTRVHHKVQVSSIWRSIENLDTSTQLSLVEALNDRAYTTGNDLKNIVSLLDFSHEYAGPTAAHVWGDTVGKKYRVKLTPDMPFNDMLDSLIETSVKPQYQDVIRATAPGTVEYAYRQQQAKDFKALTGKDLETATVEDKKAFSDKLEQRKSLLLPERDVFDSSLVDPENQERYRRYMAHYQAVADGRRSSGLGEFFGPERQEFNALSRQRGSAPVDPKAYLQTTLGDQPLPENTRSAEYKAVVKQARGNLAAKTGYPVEFGAGLPTEAYKALKNSRLAALGLVSDRDVGVKLGQGDVSGAAMKAATNAGIGLVTEQIGSALLKRAPAIVGRAAAAASSGPLVPIMAAVGAAQLVDGIVEGTTGKPIMEHIVSDSTIKNLQQTKPRTSKPKPNLYGSGKPASIVPTKPPKKPKSLVDNVTNELEYAGNQALKFLGIRK